METTKKCRECGRELPLTAFSKNKRECDGLNYRCKECDNAYQRAYKARKKAENNLPPISGNPEYADKTPRELIEDVRKLLNELRIRGYKYEGKLTYVQEIKL